MQASAKPVTTLSSHFRVQLAAGKVVEEEQGRSALHGDVVDAVIDQVNAHALVQSQLEGNFELGTYAVGRADEDGGFPALQIEPEERSKAADAAQDVAVKGLLSQVFDAVLGAISTADVDPGIGVGYGFGFGFGFVRHFGFGFVRHCTGFLRMKSRTALLAGKVDSSRI